MLTLYEPMSVARHPLPHSRGLQGHGALPPTTQPIERVNNPARVHELPCPPQPLPSPAVCGASRGRHSGETWSRKRAPSPNDPAATNNGPLQSGRAQGLQRPAGLQRSSPAPTAPARPTAAWLRARNRAKPAQARTNADRQAASARHRGNVKNPTWPRNAETPDNV